MAVHLDAKWIALILVAGYLLGKLITVYVLYRVVRVFVAWRKKRASQAEAAGGSGEDRAAPLLGEGDVEALPDTVDGPKDGGVVKDPESQQQVLRVPPPAQALGPDDV